VERLVAWYRIGSSVGAVSTLVAANLVPLIGVLWFGWNVWTILTIYWLENGIVGLINVLKMRRAAEPASLGIIIAFVVHYGIFWVVHGIFVLTLPTFTSMNGGVDGEGADFGSDPLAVAIVIAGLFISHAVSYRLNYIGRGEYLRTTGMRQAAAPYGRLVVLHLTILFGGIAIATTGAPEAAVVVLVILKTALDVGFHLAEHREPGRTRWCRERRARELG
jgi:Family of unknown function (DUF6498)